MGCFVLGSEQIFTPGGIILSEHIRYKCLDCPRVHSCFIVPVKCKVCFLHIDAKGVDAT